MTLALAAERTERIGLRPGVLVPSLRHLMVNATVCGSSACRKVSLVPPQSWSDFFV